MLQVANLCAVFLNFVLLIVKASGYPDPLRFTRVFLVLFRGKDVMKAGHLFYKSMREAAAVFYLFFIVIAITAVLGLLLFRDDLNDYDDRFDSFMNAFKAMFVLVATGNEMP